MNQHEGNPAPVPPLRYVVLRHDRVAEPHFDLMFETTPGSALATWRTPAWPVGPHAPLAPLPDHRADYLTYQGPVSGGRGAVRRVASGTHHLVASTPDALSVRLDDGLVLRLPRTTVNANSKCPAHASPSTSA